MTARPARPYRRPYFADTRYPLLYVDGNHVEKRRDGMPPGPDEPEGWDWERGLVLGQEKEEEDGLKGGRGVTELGKGKGLCFSTSFACE